MTSTETKPAAVDRHKLFERANVAEEAELYNELVSTMKEIIESGAELSINERNLLGIGYKKVVDASRNSWHNISKVENEAATSEQKQMARDYRVKIEKELRDICVELLGLLDRFLIPKATEPGAKIVYRKLKADFNRYLAEITTGDERQQVIEKSEKAYQEGIEMSKKELVATDPLRLGISLNYAVFVHEILKIPGKAQELAQDTLDEAMTDLHTIEVDTAQESTSLITILKDDIKLWRSEINGKSDELQTGK